MQSCHLSCWWPFHMHSNLKKKKDQCLCWKGWRRCYWAIDTTRTKYLHIMDEFTSSCTIYILTFWAYTCLHPKNVTEFLLSVIISIEKRSSITHHTIATLLEEIQFKTSKCILFWDSQVRSTINSWNTREHYQNINNISTWMLQEASWYLFPLPWSRIASKQMPLSSLTLRGAFFHFSSKCELLSTKSNEL